MNFFIFSGEFKRPTDGIIIKGITNLLTQLYPNSTFKFLKESHRTLRDCTEMDDELFHLEEKFDAIIIPGSPYIWEGFEKTHKIANTLKAKKMHPEAKLIWMGIGSCYKLGYTPTLPTNVIDSIFSNSLVIVRDSLAKTLIPTSTQLACPSMFCYPEGDKIPQKSGKLAVWYEPSIGLSNSVFKGEELTAFYKRFTDFVDENTDLVCVDVEEVEFAQKLGLGTPRVLKDTQDTLDTVSKYSEVLSGRVHISVPAMMSGAKIELLRVDSRHLTVEEMRGLNYSDQFNKYKEMFRDYLTSK